MLKAGSEILSTALGQGTHGTAQHVYRRVHRLLGSAYLQGYAVQVKKWKLLALAPIVFCLVIVNNA